MRLKRFHIILLSILFNAVITQAQEAHTVVGSDDCAEYSCADTTWNEDEAWTRKMTLKTNFIGWGFLMTNAALEIDIVRNLSFALPVYYSGWDCFTNTVKFRTFMIQPELRYYIPKTNGFYIGAHCGIGHWNFALGGDWRYQDHKGETPSIGGGLGLGYALHFKKNPDWGLEFSIGAGAYSSCYDVFYNESNGPYHKVGQRTVFIGVDNASISLTYEFGFRKGHDDKVKSKTKKKEGRR